MLQVYQWIGIRKFGKIEQLINLREGRPSSLLCTIYFTPLTTIVFGVSN